MKVSSALLLMATLVLPVNGQTTLKVDVRMVEVYASVTGADGKPVASLTSQDFQALEDGVPQEIQVFEPQVAALTIALLVDTTGSMANDLPHVKGAVARLLTLLKEEDAVGLYSFANGLMALSPFTNDRKSTLRAVLRTRASGGTALFDSLAQLQRELSRIGGKKAILLFTDGDDNSSALSLEAATQGMRRIGVPVYAILHGRALTEPALLKRLENISRFTGGVPFRLPQVDNLPAVFDRIGRDLQNLYLLGYQSTNDSGAAWRTITVRLPHHPNLKLRAKDGYWR